MFLRHQKTRGYKRRRGVVAAQVAVLLVLLMAFSSLTIDIGAMFNARADLQKAADAAALAGVSVYTTDDMMRVRQGTADSYAMLELMNMAKGHIDTVSPLNPTYGASSMYVEPEDMLGGWIDLKSNTSSIVTGGPLDKYLALEVTTRRTAESTNGAVQFMFAPVFGYTSAQLTAKATAVFDDRFGGLRITEKGAEILPFTIHEDAFAFELANGLDQFSYNEGGDTIDSASDGIREVRIYPYPLSGGPYEEGDGNFGVLNIGTGNQGVDAEVIQIQNGVSAEDFEMEIATSELTFTEESGAPTTYDITGSPGMEATLKDAIGSKVGDVIGFFLHDKVVLSGSNATYTITALRYGRVMAIKLTGSPNQRGLFIQPTSYVGSEIIVHEDAPSSGGLVGRILLAR